MHLISTGGHGTSVEHRKVVHIAEQTSWLFENRNTLLESTHEFEF